jgi:hypothetical protein
MAGAAEGVEKTLGVYTRLLPTVRLPCTNCGKLPRTLLANLRGSCLKPAHSVATHVQKTPLRGLSQLIEST